MSRTSMVVYEEDHARLSTLLEHVRADTNAKFVLLLDKAGQQVAYAGGLDGADLTALASLTAGNVAATEGLAQLIGENAFSTLFHEGQNDSLHISLVSQKFIMLVIFDEHSSLGLVRLRVKQRADDLARVMDEIHGRDGSAGPPAGSAASSFDDITDEDIDALFG